ncbi:odorant receptor 13a-like [Vespula maculifrons]|uniref:Odorant receptor 13a-like n=1 Tax=Vespula maculifrons TaxID=7453 RepID=A0ABD2BPI8_VESMC
MNTINEEGIANVQKSFLWSSRLLRCMGVWPLKNYFPIFLFFFSYLCIHCTLTLAQLISAPKTMDNVVSNIAENILLTMTLTKITITRINREALRKLFVEIEEYVLTEKYETTEEKLTFLNYTKLPPFFIAMIGCSMSLEEVLYYTNRLMEGIECDLPPCTIRLEIIFTSYEDDQSGPMEFDNNVLKRPLQSDSRTTEAFELPQPIAVDNYCPQLERLQNTLLKKLMALVNSKHVIPLHTNDGVRGPRITKDNNNQLC